MARFEVPAFQRDRARDHHVSGDGVLALLADEAADEADILAADSCRLIDLRPYRQAFADGSAVVQLSARFSAVEFPPTETCQRKMKMRALPAGFPFCIPPALGVETCPRLGGPYEAS